VKLYSNELFHIYNRGNNRQQIFFNRENFIYFLEKVNIFLKPYAGVMAWCLMPNHFHFMVYISPEKDVKELSKAIQIILWSYTRGINKEQGRIGSLFTQNTCLKAFLDEFREKKTSYAETCFHYIHQNPMRAGLVKQMEDWEFSSFRDYVGLRNGKLINRTVTNQFLGISEDVSSHSNLNDVFNSVKYLISLKSILNFEPT
jgi:REP element-mobilizing transposase RayT